MIIINYRHHISKHYLLSHLLLGVIAAGFGLSAYSLFRHGSTFDAKVGMIVMTVITKANHYASSQRMTETARADRLTALRLLIAKYTDHDTYSLFNSPILKGQFLTTIAIRAGPTGRV